MQTVKMNKQASATDTGVDHPTPPAPDRGSSKTKPKPGKPSKRN